MIGILSVLKRNIKILFLSLMTCIALVFFVKNPNLFEASVLNVGEISFIQENKRDIAYKTTGNILDIFVSSDLQNTNQLDKLNISIAYDPSISLSQNILEAQTDFQITASGNNYIDISLQSTSGIDSQRSLFMIPFSGNNSHILIQDAYIILSDGTQKDLSVGNLTTQYLHN